MKSPTAGDKQDLHDASNVQLLTAVMLLKSRRNFAIAGGVLALIVIFWMKWSLWTVVIPSFFWLLAAGQHFEMSRIFAEMRTRKNEGEKRIGEE